MSANDDKTKCGKGKKEQEDPKGMLHGPTYTMSTYIQIHHVAMSMHGDKMSAIWIWITSMPKDGVRHLCICTWMAL